MAPDIFNSTQKEREQFIKEQFPCISDCDNCGFCAQFHGKDPVLAYREYIEGNCDFIELSKKLKEGKCI